MLNEPDLNLAGQVGQLVDRENAAVGPRQQPVVHRQLARELQARPRRLDRIDVADHVGDGHVGRRQLLDVAQVARQPVDRRAVALGGDARRGTRAQIGASGSSLISQPGITGISSSSSVDQRAQQARLGLTAQAKQDEVVLREQRVDQLRNDAVVVADDAGEQRSRRCAAPESGCRELPPARSGAPRRPARRPDAVHPAWRWTFLDIG